MSTDTSATSKRKPLTTDEVLDIMDASEAAEEAGDHELAVKIMRQIPLPATLAKAYVSSFGKEWLLKRGYDLSEADEVLGEGWIDRIPYKLAFLDELPKV